MATCWWIFRRKVFRESRRPRLYSAGATIGFYLLCTVLVIPPLAALGGRKPLPWFAGESMPLAPRSVLYCVLNRHYVSTELYEVIVHSAEQLEEAYPGSRVHYLDGGFPFLEGFPLVPHLSHDDGRKIDFTYCYRLACKPDQPALSPSPIGYWIYEPPEGAEPDPYAGKGCWLRWDFAPFQGLGRHREFDAERTRRFLRILLAQPETEKLLLELHLQRRMGLSDPKLKFQQCMAARHDDHIHFQIRE